MDSMFTMTLGVNKRYDTENLDDIDKRMRTMYKKLMNSYEDIMVQMKYTFGMNDIEIKKEMNRLNKLYLKEFFKRAK